MLSPSELEIARELPPSACGQQEAERYTRRLATSHYENFNVVSWLLPKRLHQHFYNLYAYCRWADDLGDEIPDTARALELLAWWEDELRLCYAGKPQHPVFVALAGTIREFSIPAQPFADLLTAFRQDQVVQRYATWDDVLGYCKYSANPVGRLVLYLCGYRDAERQWLSDATCTALQLANFWQDVSRDLEKGRIYIPLDLLRKHGLGFEDVEARRFSDRYAALMRELIARTRELFAEGTPLAEQVSAELRVDIEMFGRGGLAVLDAIESIGYNTLEHRPSISKGKQVRLLGRALVGRLFTLRPSSGAAEPGTVHGSHGKSEPQSVTASYDECRKIARNAASSFYPAFFLLPEAKRRSLCALYAFFRLLDDVSDDASGSALKSESPEGAKIAARRASIAQWRAWVDAAYAGDVSGHRILPAFADTATRFKIPARYFHDLISGSEMDLTEPSYATFDRLREYCYRVAGTVGLTCIHVFGFSDPKAPDLAEKLGIAFQLTNILRDVPEDLRMGRVYLPQEDLRQFGVSPSALAGPLAPQLGELLAFEADRAWQFYEEGSRIISLLDDDSRGALWALARNYSSLLARIESRGYDVFSSRVRLSTPEKLGILARAQLGVWSEGNVLEKRDRGRRRPGGPFVGRRAG
ncbi:MAG TPA: squalene synthase HpnC [Candidatus Acidoferrales bacterium]|nr:squalene synthase HpnC [Candidatus Acidoferrales bacterium]